MPAKPRKITLAALAVCVTAAIAGAPVAHAECSDNMSAGQEGYLSWLCHYSKAYSQHTDAEWLDLGHEVCQDLAGGAKGFDLEDRLMDQAWERSAADDLVSEADVYLCPPDALGHRKGF